MIPLISMSNCFNLSHFEPCQARHSLVTLAEFEKRHLNRCRGNVRAYFGHGEAASCTRIHLPFKLMWNCGQKQVHSTKRPLTELSCQISKSNLREVLHGVMSFWACLFNVDVVVLLFSLVWGHLARRNHTNSPSCISNAYCNIDNFKQWNN